MHPALWINMTGLIAQDYNLNAASHNLSNISTIGYKKNRVTFEDLFYQIIRQPGAKSNQSNEFPSGFQQGTGVRVVASHKNFTAGSYQTTSSPLDLAVYGKGFFQVMQPDGNPAFTRNGEFQLDSEGNIVNAQGLPLEPVITVPVDAMGITIGEDGTVSARMPGDPQPQELGQINLVSFINQAGLEARGANLFVNTEASGDPQEGVPGENGLGFIKQSTLEASNVAAVEELVNLIVAQRAYEMGTKAVKATDEMMSFLIRSS